MAVMQAISRLESTQSMLETVGFQPLVFEDFLETFTGLIRRVAEQPPLTHAGLLEAFVDPEGTPPPLSAPQVWCVCH